MISNPEEIWSLSLIIFIIKSIKATYFLSIFADCSIFSIISAVSLQEFKKSCMFWNRVANRALEYIIIAVFAILGGYEF